MTKYILLFFTSFFAQFLHAQSISGQVIDEIEQPIIGVQIALLNGIEHTHSDEYGNFMLNKIQTGDTIIFVFLGYETKKFVVGEELDDISITLEEKPISIKEVVVMPELNAIDIISDIDIKTQPVNSSQDILRQVPGLFIGQHAGGGKAEQIFLRGFDIDHGTDIAITVDGMPVNMVSHAHGQGYADLHFVIPETIERVNFSTGSYQANKGNFATAGFIDFQTKSQLKSSLLKAEIGQFNTGRVVGLLNVLNTATQDAYIATEYISTDGPFESPQNFNRFNFQAKYSAKLKKNDKISISASHFTSTWDASGQIPQRSVDNNSISRFGAIDDTEGGTTSRSNIIIDYDKKINNKTFIRNKFYYSKYDFELFSNFTFFLEDPILGDQIKQQENRDLLGAKSDITHYFVTDYFSGNLQAGLEFRNDRSYNNLLANTVNRNEITSFVQNGDINETNVGSFISSTFQFNKFTINPSIRFDYFDFQYENHLTSIYSPQSNQEVIFSPKLNILYNATSNMQLYWKLGKGFHSNDTRVVLNDQDGNIIPASYGFDAGIIWKPISNLIVNTAYWYMFLEQEFVYVGDAGIVEPSGKTRRQGIDLSIRYQPLEWLFWDVDVNATKARSVDDEEGSNLIPLAPNFTVVSGLNAIHKSGVYGGLHLRYLGDRPANEDNSIVAKGYTVFDFNVGYKYKRLDFGIQIQNLFDTEWNETQFATESRLANELLPVEEIHFTPGTPFFLKGVVSYSF